MGKIYSTSLKEMNLLIKQDKTIDPSTIFLVTRSNKIEESVIANGWNYMQNLGPDWELFKKVKKLKEGGKWDRETFDTLYDKEYRIQISCDTDAIKNIIKITKELYKGNDVYIVCYCDLPYMCHRKIVCELTSKVTGAEVLYGISG